jgi:ferric-dicitrate binding protein FerR (iron transport regulator)
MSEKHELPLSIRVLLCLWLLPCWQLQHAQASECEESVAHAISVQGQVEARSAESTPWRLIKQGDGLCAGDRLRVGENSRAGLHLSNETYLRLGEKSTITFSGLANGTATWLDLLEGFAHFISRIKHSFQVNTPYVNAAIEGTEFTIEVSPEQAHVTVLEGRVRAYNPQGEIVLEDGQGARVSPGHAPIIQLTVQPRDAVTWALYYPPFIDFHRDFAAAELRQSLAAFRRGEITQAFAWLRRYQGDETVQLYSYRASLNLAVGRVGAARADIAAALAVQADAADALALRSLIATLENDSEAALSFAQLGVTANPRAAGPLLALSYAQQARFDLAAAAASVHKALTLAPDSALAWSRMVQLELMLGDPAAALVAARRAEAISPDLSQTQTALGFTHLVGLEIERAQQAFRRATSLDQADPLPRLGLGLALIRAGSLSEGRQQIEIATSLDPGNALIRSYLGKAYFEERRGRLAGTQYDLAKALDPLDPTAWFYDAILQQTQNRPVAALGEVQTSIRLNDKRAVYRSRLLLDSDEAARSASLARIYNDLGFAQLGFKQGWQSLAADEADHAAHRLLADAYLGTPRHEIARVSELLQAQLLQPEGVVPVSPSAAEAHLLAFEGAGPSVAGFNEYTPLFNREHSSVLVSGVLGSNETQGGEVVAGTFFNRGMLSAGYYQDQTDGFRDNSDSDQTIKNLFGQFRVTPELSIQGEYRNRQSEFGDTALRFNPEDYFPTQRRTIEVENWRLGLNYAPNPNQTLLFSLITQDMQDKTDFDFLSVETQNAGEQYEAQFIQHGSAYQWLAGLGYLDLRQQEAKRFSLFGLPFSEQRELDVRQQTAHAYLHLPGSNLLGVLGFDYADIDQQNGINETAFNPKLGLIWELSDSAMLRMAAFRTLRTELLNSQTIAPTQVAGFNQFFDDALGSKAWRYGIGYDQRFMSHLHGGIELSRRELTEPVLSTGLVEETQDERSHRAYLYWTPDTRYALSAEYRYEDFSRDYQNGEADLERPAEMQTRSWLLGARYFHPSGVFAGVTASHVDQHLAMVLPTTGTEELKDAFWITDVSLGYRLPERRGRLELQVRNLFDQEFHFQSIHPGTGTPQSSPYYPDRAVFLHAQLWF